MGIPELMAMEAMAKTGSDWLTRSILDKKQKQDEKEAFIRQTLMKDVADKITRGEYVSREQIGLPEYLNPKTQPAPQPDFTPTSSSLAPSVTSSLENYLSQTPPATSEQNPIIEQPITQDQSRDLIESVYSGKSFPSNIKHRPTEIPKNLTPSSYQSPSGIKYTKPYEETPLQASNRKYKDWLMTPAGKRASANDPTINQALASVDNHIAQARSYDVQAENSRLDGDNTDAQYWSNLAERERGRANAIQVDIDKKLSSKISEVAPIPPAGQPGGGAVKPKTRSATNKTTGEKMYSEDNGKTWHK